MSKGQQGNTTGDPVPTPPDLATRDVESFGDFMVQKIMERKEYGYWHGPPLEFYKDRMVGEMTEFLHAFEQNNIQAAAAEAVDIANFCMMFWINAHGIHGMHPTPSLARVTLNRQEPDEAEASKEEAVLQKYLISIPKMRG